MRNRTQLLVVAGVALAAGCTVGPEFKRPDGVQAATYTREPLTALDASGVVLLSGQNPSADWWTQFGSDPLDHVMHQALTGNQTLAAAQSSLAQAQDVIRATAGPLYPQFSLGGGVGRQKYGAQFLGPQTIPPFTYFALGPVVTYTLDYLGSQRRTVERARALADYQACQVQAAYLSLTGTVVQQALAMAAARAQLDTLQRLEHEDETNLSLVQTAFRAGSATRVDVLSAQSQLANDRTLAPPLRQQVSVARHALAVLVGRTPGEWTPPEFALADLQLPQTLPLTLPSELAHRRPDILAAEAQLHAAVAAVGVATAALYPQVTLSATAGAQSTGIEHWFDASSKAWGLSAAITAPILNGGTLAAQRQEARDSAVAALANYRQAVLQAFGQVADSLTALAYDGEQLAAQKAALEAGSASLELTRRSYAVGNVGVLQVLDAERRFQQANLGMVRAQAQRYIDSVQLFLALGGSAPEADTGSPAPP